VFLDYGRLKAELQTIQSGVALVTVPQRMPLIKISDRQLEYEWHGPSPDAAPTLIFLHEGLGCVAMWRDFPERVAEATGCGVLVYSRAGYGNSDSIALPRPIKLFPVRFGDIQLQRSSLGGST